MNPTELRHHLHGAGFSPIPVNGKHPVMDEWQKCVATQVEIDSWAEGKYAYAKNTGVLTKFTPVIDIDILNPDAAAAVEALVKHRFEDGPILLRIGKAPKRAIPFKTDRPFPKISAVLISPNGNEERIEFLCDGQQVVVDGIHPDTRKPYHWHGGELGEIKHDELPTIDAEAAQQLVNYVVELLIVEHGYRLKEVSKARDNAKVGDGGGNGADGVDWGDFIANPLDHDKLTAFAMSLLKSGMDSRAANNLLTAHVKVLQGVDEERRQRRFTEISGMLSSARAKLGRDDPKSKPLDLRYGFDATQAEPLGTIVEGVLHAKSLTLMYGSPKSGKTFIATDLALAITDESRDDWMGHAIVRHGAVLYVACEGHAGFWKRLVAAAKTRGWDCDSFPPGFILASGRPMLIKADERGLHYAPDPSAILAALEDAERRGLKPVAIIIDTVFRSFGIGNVNASPDMNVYLAALAMLTDQGYAVVPVHHEIKSGGTPAGSVSLIGGADTIIHVWREEETSTRRFWQVEMAKDDAETPPRSFDLNIVEIGLDPEGRVASSGVIRDDGPAPDAKKKRGRPADEGSAEAILASLIYDKLCNLLADPNEGQFISLYPSLHPPAPPIRAIKRARLRVAINEAGFVETTSDPADEKRVKRANDLLVHRAINRLGKRGKVAANRDWIGVQK